MGPALLLERGQVREGVEARAEALALRRRRAGLLGTSALDVELSVVFGTFVVEYGQNNYADALEGSCGSARMLCARQVTRGVPRNGARDVARSMMSLLSLRSETH